MTADAARADPEITQDAAAAVLVLRAELARTEQAALAAARRTGVSAEVIAIAQRDDPAAGERQ